MDMATTSDSEAERNGELVLLPGEKIEVRRLADPDRLEGRLWRAGVAAVAFAVLLGTAVVVFTCMAGVAPGRRRFLERQGLNLQVKAQQQCGLVENGVDYVVEDGLASLVNGAANAASCCSACGKLPRCRAWTWVKARVGAPARCWLKGAGALKRLRNPGVISGLPAGSSATPLSQDHKADAGALGGGVYAPTSRPPSTALPTSAALPTTAAPAVVTTRTLAAPATAVKQAGSAVRLKVLTYNLFWWNLFGLRGGNGGSAGRLIAQAGRAMPLDVMAFQECQDPQRVLRAAGLWGQYIVFGGDGTGSAALCTAFRSSTWQLLGHGLEYVAEDTRQQYFGRRAAMWLRLQHRQTGRKLLFVNHHGPLPLNSGGIQGGATLASRLLRLVQEHAQAGDGVVLVGDFNANPTSATVQHLEGSLRRIFTGRVDGGIDHVFTNLGPESVLATENLGPGGSDHDALSAELLLSGGGAAGGAGESVLFRKL
mmetsp:Transcript_133752/g.286022  ORF Transcript_133752/g.286022 Transcript_133752/m.286022 type:complete len:483 (-) Transcript_133752:67-1515(-)